MKTLDRRAPMILASVDEIAAALHYEPHTVRDWRRDERRSCPMPPPCASFGNSPLWDLSLVLIWDAHYRRYWLGPNRGVRR